MSSPSPTAVSGAAGSDAASTGAEMGTPIGLDQVQDIIRRIAANMELVIVGKPEVVRTCLVTLLAQGHLLVEDVPGVGKTSLNT